MKNILKIIGLSLITSSMTMLIVFVLYSLYHFGFGQVTVPEWFTGQDSNGYPVPFPIEKAIQYWINKGQTAALKSGVVLFVLTLLFIGLKGGFTKRLNSVDAQQ